MALWCYHFFDADKHKRNIKIARLFEQSYGWNLFSLFLWVIDHKNCANIILFHQSTSSFNKICNTTKEMMRSELRAQVLTKCYTINYKFKRLILVLIIMKSVFGHLFASFKKGIIIFCGSNYGIQLNVYSSWQASVTQTYLTSTCKIRNTIFFCA